MKDPRGSEPSEVGWDETDFNWVRIPEVGSVMVMDNKFVEDGRRRFTYAILDKDDRWLEMGFDLRAGFNATPSPRDMMRVLLGRLDSAPESFQPAAEEWARQHRDQIGAARVDLEDEGWR